MGGFGSNGREVDKGSMLNKAILVPAALGCVQGFVVWRGRTHFLPLIRDNPERRDSSARAGFSERALLVRRPQALPSEPHVWDVLVVRRGKRNWRRSWRRRSPRQNHNGDSH